MSPRTLLGRLSGLTERDPSRGRRGGLGRPLGAAAAVVAAVALAVTPLSATPYTNLQLSLIATYAVAILGLNLVTGYAGQISLGQSAFFGLGAYATAIATVDGGWPLPLSFALACALPAAVGALVAVPAVRMRGHALAILTLALPVVAVPLARRYTDLTGGSAGKSALIADAPAWTGLDDDQWAFYVVAVVAAVLFVLARNAMTGRLGRALAMIRHNDAVAGAMGVSPGRYKAFAFCLAATYGGAAGWLYVFSVGFVSPEALELLLGVNLLASVIVGGMGSVAGSLIGGVFYVGVPAVLAGSVNPARTSLLYGVVLLVVIFFAPGGIAGTARRLGAWLAGARRRGQPPPPPVTSTGTGTHPDQHLAADQTT